jgi:hypothetical protein
MSATKEHLSRICAGGFSGALMSLVLSMPKCAGKLLRAQHGVPV